MNRLVAAATLALVFSGCGEADPKGSGNNAVNNQNNFNSQNNSNNANNTNNTTNTNSQNTNSSNNGERVYDFFLIRDTTAGDGCEVADAGSDLQYVAISDFTGTIIGYASARDVALGDGTEFTDVSVLDGNPPDFAGECTDNFSDLSVFSLGCEGAILMQPLDGTGTPFSLLPFEHQIQVGEYGTQCGGSADDTYEIYACEEGDGTLAGSNCEFFLASGEGLIIVEVE